MSKRENKLGDALMAADVASIPEADARQLALTALHRDRRRLRWLAGLALLFWLLAAAGLILTTYIYFEPLTAKTDTILVGLEPDVLKTEAERRAWQREMYSSLRTIANVGFWFVTGCVVTMALAAAFTVLLVLSSRRATLNHVNANLSEISRQLAAVVAEDKISENAADDIDRGHLSE